MIHVALKQIPTSFAHQHQVDEDRVQTIMKVLSRDGLNSERVDWCLPPLLVLEDEGHGFTLFDGHHRAAAALRLKLETVPAYIIRISDLYRVVIGHFNGFTPNRISYLDKYIVLPDGRIYADAEVR